MERLPSIFTLFYAIAEILTMTFGGRIVLGAIVGSMILRAVTRA